MTIAWDEELEDFEPKQLEHAAEVIHAICRSSTICKRSARESRMSFPVVPRPRMSSCACRASASG